MAEGGTMAMAEGSGVAMAEGVMLADRPDLSRAVMGDPGAGGRFGPFGGRFVPEALIPACAELEAAFRGAWADQGFRAELSRLLAEYAGRPTPLTVAPRMSAELGVQVLLKREDLAHTGSHKINNVAGQALLASRMGKTALVAETGAGQHGVAAATVAAHLGLGCTVYMGERDMARQELNVFRMELLGATVVPVRSGSRTLKDATNEALRHWVTTVDSTHYCIGSVLGPHPYPWLVRELQRVIGDEARAQCAALAAAGRLAQPVPDVAVACVGGGSNAAGTFAGFAGTAARLVGVEAAGGAALAAGPWPVPLIAMSYANLAFRPGLPGYCAGLAAAGVSGMIIPDLPVAEADGYLAAAVQAGLDATLMITPATPGTQRRVIAARTRGFLYVMSVMATTGTTAQQQDPSRWAVAAEALAAQPQDAGGGRPVLIGFGISTPARAAAAARHADGVIVASALMRRVLAGATPAEVGRAAGELRRAVDGARS